MLGDEEPGVAHGIALGVGGVDGWWVWKHRRRLRNGIEAVSPASISGAVHVLAWLAGLAAITTLGPLLVDGPRVAWFGVGLTVMLGIARWWDVHAGGSATSSDVQ